MTFNKCTIQGKKYGDVGEDNNRGQGGIEEVKILWWQKDFVKLNFSPVFFHNTKKTREIKYSKDPNTRGVPNNCLQNDTFLKT